MTETPSSGNGNDTTTAPRPPETRPRRLVRVKRGRVWCGVAAGLGAYTGTDPVLWRIGFVVGTIFTGGMVALAYLILWLVMPEEDQERSVLEDGTAGLSLPDRDRTRRWLGIAAIVIGAAILLDDVWHLRGGLVLGLLLVGVGIALWGRELTGDEEAPPPDEGSGQSVAPAADEGPATSPSGDVPPPSDAPPPPEEHPRPRRRQPRSILGRLVLGAAALVVGAGLLLDNLGAIDLTAGWVLTALLAATGVGLLVGAWWGRARWLIVPGVLLTLVLAAASASPFDAAAFGEGVGERQVRPSSVTELGREYRLGVGELTLDLSRLELDGRVREVEVRIGIGEVKILVPEEPTVVVEARSGIGEVELFGVSQGGFGVNTDQRDRGDPGAGRLVLELRVGMGQVTVAREGTAAAQRMDIDGWALRPAVSRGAR